MEFRVLGVLEVCDQGELVPIGTPRTRTVLSVLLTHPGEVVSVDRLVDELWPDQPPQGARTQVHDYLSRLRRALRAGPGGQAAADRLVTRKPGYLIQVYDQELDRHRFEQLLTEARTSYGHEQFDRSLQLYHEAHRLWRGDPFADVPPTPTIAAATTTLGQLHVTSLEERYELVLALEASTDEDLVGDLTKLVDANPLRERPVTLLMRALHRAGRTADALEAGRRAKQRLADQLGIDPGPQLQQTERAILRGEIDTTAPSTPSWSRTKVRPAQLPADVSAFTGRTEQLEDLDALLAAIGARPTAVVISALSGTAGVGKTALAIHWAHRVADRFPDGQLYINLRGYSPGPPLTPIEVLAGFLHTLGLRGADIPVSLDLAAATYRSLLADRRMLVVLDNASDAGQVRPLLPGATGCLVVVTSRHQLSSLVAVDGAYPLALDLLTIGESHQLLERRLGGGRLAAEPAATEEIIARCARLPLALTIIAARAATRPHHPLSDLARELRESPASLDTWNDPDPAVDIRAVLDVSYRTLSSDTARLYRLLGLHPGPDLSCSAAASLAGVAPQRARALLADLAAQNLVAEPAPGRYALHDLLRSFAAERAHEVDTDRQRRAARHRMLDHYLHSAYAASRLSNALYPIVPEPAQPGSTAEHLIDRSAALSWFSTEHRVLQAAVRESARTGFSTHSWQLAWAMGTYTGYSGLLRDQVDVGRMALDASCQAADRTGQAHSHRLIGNAQLQLTEHQPARHHLQAALGLFRELGSHAGQAMVHSDLGQLAAAERRYHDALDHVRQQVDHYRAAGSRMGEAGGLNNLGLVYGLLGEHQQTLHYSAQAIAIHQEGGDRIGEAHAWDSKGSAYHQLGDHRLAIACFQRSLDLLREDGIFRFTEAEVLAHLGEAQDVIGDHQAARTTWQQTLALLDELGHPSADEVRARLSRLPVARAAGRSDGNADRSGTT